MTIPINYHMHNINSLKPLDITFDKMKRHNVNITELLRVCDLAQAYEY